MKIEFDPNKSEKNRQERGLPFDDVKAFDWQTAIIWQDDQFNYPEIRLNALGLIDERVYSVTFTPVKEGIRVISFRKANKREVTRYEQQSI